MASSRHGMPWEWPFCVLYLLHFCTLFFNPHLDLEPDYITIKQMKHRFQQCIVRTEILSTKSPLVTMGCPKFIHPFDVHQPNLYTHPSTNPTHHHKQHPDPISRFATIHFADFQPDRSTDRQTDGPGERSVLQALRSPF